MRGCRLLPIMAGISAVLMIAAHGASLEDGKAVFAATRRHDEAYGIGRVAKGTAAYGPDTATAAETVASLAGTLDRSSFLPGSDVAESKIKPAIFNAGDHVRSADRGSADPDCTTSPGSEVRRQGSDRCRIHRNRQRLQCLSHRISQGRVMLPFQRQPIVAALTLMLLSGAIPAVAEQDAVSRGEDLVRAGSAGARRLRGGILDCRCARRSASRQVGTKGWSFPIEQRDTAIDLKTRQRTLDMTNLLNLTYTTPHTEFTVAQAGIKGVARRSLSAWRDKSADPRRTPDGLPARTCARINLNEVRNETLSVATAALVLAVAANLAPAVAQGPKTSGGNGWPGISQRVDSGSPSAITTTSHYEYQYGYDHHGVWRGHWVLVR
jgi:hypothetical protein